MRKLSFISTLFVAAFVIVSFFSCTAQTPKANLKSDIDSLSYAFGVVNTQGIGSYLEQQGIDSAHIKDFIAGVVAGANISKEDKAANARQLGQGIGMNIAAGMEGLSRNLLGEDSTKVLNKSNLLAGFIDGVLNKNFAIPQEGVQDYLQKTSDSIKAISMEKQHAEEKAKNMQYLEDNKAKQGIITLPSGLQYEVIKEGTGSKPTATDLVEVDYTGTTIDGTEFDSTSKRGEHAKFRLDQVIKGWTEGIQLMPAGSKYKFYIPYDLAYGAQGRPGSIPPFATLIFEVELYAINPK